ncbi:hypothetical protein AMTR_s00136p00102030 [Amborella trichopoda]|uniref:Uncharacterized protein n=1 Tax=Amborella trichopoda TaxID=13333 RepID=W1NEX9_AMBTC|nr:hypothetical protein AMTR_s00136p00102030 [Amborella trichopoda]
MVLAVMAVVAMADDNNNVFQLFQDTRIQKSDGFTFGQKYAARSPSTFVANSTYTVPSFTLVLE